MSLKLVLGFVFFGILSVYIAFLNPQDITLQLTQSYSLHLPIVVLLLGSIVIGVMISGLAEGLRLLRGLPAIMRRKYLNRRRENLRRKCEKLYETAENALIGGHTQKAYTLFEKILSLHSDHIPSLNQLGDIMRREGKRHQAVEVHATAVRLAPHKLKSLYSLAQDYSALSQHEREIEILQKTLEHEPDSLLFLHRLRDAWLKAPDWEQAVRIQKTILSLTSRHESEIERRRLGEIIYDAATRHLEQGDIESAKAELKRSIKESRNSLSAFITLGDIYFRGNSRKDALKIWKAGYGRTKSPVCLQRIRGIGDDEAIKLCESEARSNPYRDDLAILLGSLFLEKGENEKAVQILESAADNSSLLRQILLIVARQAKNCNGQLPDPMLSILNKIKQSFANYACKKCLASFQEWSSHCPTCQSWDSVVWEHEIIDQPQRH